MFNTTQCTKRIKVPIYQRTGNYWGSILATPSSYKKNTTMHYAKSTRASPPVCPIEPPSVS